MQEAMTAEVGLTPLQVEDIRKKFEVDKPVAPPVVEIPIPIKVRAEVFKIIKYYLFYFCCCCYCC